MIFEIVFLEGHQFCKVRLLLSLVVVATCHYIWLCLWLVLFAVTRFKIYMEFSRTSIPRGDEWQ